MKKIFLAAFISCALISCESKEDDQIYSAQQCLNTATASTVDTCVAKVSGLATSESYVIRCSADFIKQDISTERIVNAMEDLDNGTGNVTVKALSFFTFRTVNAETGSTLAARAVADCSLTGSQILKDLALLAQMATIVSGLAGLTPGAEGIDPDDLNSWLSTVDPNALSNTELEALGGVIQQAQPSYCGTGGQFEGTEVCTDLNNAVGGGNAAQIAKDLLDQLKN